MQERKTDFPTPGNSTNGDGLLGMACSDNNMTASGVPVKFKALGRVINLKVTYGMKEFQASQWMA